MTEPVPCHRFQLVCGPVTEIERPRAGQLEGIAAVADMPKVQLRGARDQMAKDVDTALHDIVARCGGMDAAAAHAYVNDLIKTHRYVRDVY